MKDTIAITYSANPADTLRTGTVYILSNASNSPETLTVHQAGRPVLPKRVTLLGPIDGASLSPDSTVQLLWERQEVASRYWLEVGLDSLFAFTFRDSTVADTLCHFKPQASAGYFWRVRAANAVGWWGPYSPTWHFMVSLTAIEAGLPLPRQYALTQNYPNPFNPSTMIRFALPSRSHVTLIVYNTLGQKLAELVNGDIEAGNHEIRFDGSNLSSGVYFYRMEAGSYTETRTFALMK